jgi:hypothetical protein
MQLMCYSPLFNLLFSSFLCTSAFRPSKPRLILFSAVNVPGGKAAQIKVNAVFKLSAAIFVKLAERTRVCRLFPAVKSAPLFVSTPSPPKGT